MDLRPPPASRPEPPHVPGLRLERVLGRGGHAEVWEAVDAGTGERVAVKLRRAPAPAGPGPRDGSAAARHRPGARWPGSGARPRAGGRDSGGDVAGDAQEAAQRLAREIALLRGIDHPHVVRLRRVLDLPDGSRAMVLDHAAGGSLAALVRSRGRLRPAEVTTLLVALARALADLHGRGLVHGDLSPGNVLFTGDGRPLLSDLGLAAVLGAELPEAAWGTPGFIDPAPLPAGDPARDVWGLGAVAWFALTGRPPAGALDADPDRARPGVDAPAGRGEGPPTGRPAGWDLPARGVHPDAVPVGEMLQVRDAARRAALLRLIRDCLADEPVHRPDPADLARRAWRAVPPSPVRLPDPGERLAAGASTPGGRVSEPAPDQADRDGHPSDSAVSDSALSDSALSDSALVPGEGAGFGHGAGSGEPAGSGADTGPGADAWQVVTGPREVAADPGTGGGRLVAGPWTLRSPTRPGTNRPGMARAVSTRWAGTDPVGAPGDPFGGPGAAGGPTPQPGDATGAAYVDVTRRIREQAARADPRRTAPRRPGRRVVVGAVALVLVLAVGAGLLVTGRWPLRHPGRAAGDPPVGAAAVGGASHLCVAADPSSAELARTVCVLARGRAAAFAGPSTAPLASVDEPGSAALAADEELVHRLQGQGLRLRGVSFAVTEVRVVARTSAEATVTASVATSAHQQVRADGSVAAEVPAAAPRAVRLVLVSRTGVPGWWVRSVEGG